MAEPIRFAVRAGREMSSLGASSAVTSQALSSFSTVAPHGRGRIDENHEQIREFCSFLAREWRGSRHHSYAVPSRGKSSAWSRTIDGKWSAVGLADAVSKYAWSGKSFSESKAELDRFAANLQSAIQRDSNNDVCEILRAIMHWGGVDNKHRQKGTFEWIERNADEISVKLSNAVDLIKDEQASLDPFDGVSLIMNDDEDREPRRPRTEACDLRWSSRRCARLLRCQIYGRARNSSIRRCRAATFRRGPRGQTVPRDEAHSFSGIVRRSQGSLPCLDGTIGIATNLASREGMPGESKRNRSCLVYVGI
jgi:hypothetical protein